VSSDLSPILSLSDVDPHSSCTDCASGGAADATVGLAAAWRAWWPWARPLSRGATSQANPTAGVPALAVSTHTRR
jgi:hypothetical protein